MFQNCIHWSNLFSLSHKGGLGVKLQNELGRPIQIRHHCLAHRFDLITDNAMEKFSIFNYFDSAMRSLYSFYSVSHKRLNSLKEFLKAIHMPKFRLGAIFNVRWIASFRSAVAKVKNNFYPLVEHFNYILNNLNEFVKDRKDAFKLKVETMKDFLTNKFAMSLLHFNYDILDRFSVESVYTQRKGSTLIGAGRRKKKLINKLKSIKLGKGKEFENFLADCNCFWTLKQATAFVNGRGNPRPCSDLAAYERNPFIVYKNIIMKNTGLMDESTNQLKYTKLSEYMGPYVDELIQQIENYLPSDEVLKFDPLDQRVWQLTRWKIPSIKALAEVFKMDQDLIQQQFIALVKDIMLGNWRVGDIHCHLSFNWGICNYFIILVVLQAQSK